MNYYEKIIQEKKNSKFHYKLIDEGYLGILKDEGQHKWTVQTWYGTKLMDEQELIGPKSKAEAQGQKNVSSFERRYPENSKEEKDNESVQDKFRYKGCMITILKKSENQYTFTIEQNGHEEGSNRTYSTQDEAERGAKREVEEVWSSKDNSKSYYQSIIEKKNANPEESMRKLQALKPIVEAFKRKGMTKHEVAMRLMQERDITETLAQQCVDTWY